MTHKFRYLIALAIPLVAVALIMVIQVFFLKYGLIPDNIHKLTPVNMLTIIFIQASVFIAIALMLILKLKIHFFGLGDEISGKDLFYGYAGLLAVNLGGSLFMTATGTQPDQFKDFDAQLLRKGIYVFMFTVAFLGPIYEEFIFRGVMLGMLAGKAASFKNNIPAVLYTSALFMMAHFEDIRENIYIGLPLFLLGVYFSYWAIRKKGIMLTIILHMSQNFAAAMALLYATK